MKEDLTLAALLKADEEKLRNELLADELIDQNRKQSTARLSEYFGQMLLRYNAANSADPERQALADCMTATARDMLDLLQAGIAKKEIEKRRVRAGAIITMLIAVICGLLAVLLIREYFIPGCVLIAAAALFGFLSGRLWYGEREVRVHAGLDPEQIWKTLKKATETMDRKTGDFLAQKALWEQSSIVGKDHPGSSSLGSEELKLYGDLLEALYSSNGDFALRQLKKVPAYLNAENIELRDYSPADTELFELLPSRRGSVTLRPALLADDKLLLVGRATEAEQ